MGVAGPPRWGVVLFWIVPTRYSINLEWIMTAKTVTDDQATAASTAALAAAEAPVVDHDRPVTPTGAGRIRFKGHTAQAGYPWRIYEGRVEAYVDGAWVEAPDSEPVD